MSMLTFRKYWLKSLKILFLFLSQNQYSDEVLTKKLPNFFITRRFGVKVRFTVKSFLIDSVQKPRKISCFSYIRTVNIICVDKIFGQIHKMFVS